MPAPRFSASQLEAYLNEELPSAQMSAIEQALRDDRQLTERLAAIHARRDAGVHSLGEIWRQARLSCASREQLGSYLLEALPDEEADYIRFHLEVVGCRYCQANLADLTAKQSEADDSVDQRRRKYFQSSAGLLRRSDS